MKNVFESVYPFTTENISGYYPSLDLKDKDVLSVGSSGDQAFNAILCGAGKVTLMDISPHIYEFVKLKRDIILDSTRKQTFKRVLKIDSVPTSKDLFSYKDLVKMNPYLKDDKSFNLLKDKLKDTDIDFIIGDIFKFNDAVGDKKFDRMIFSNVLQYLDLYAKMQGYEGKTNEFLIKNFEEWDSHLKDEGIIQLLYLYSMRGQDRELYNFGNALQKKVLLCSTFPSINEQDTSAIVYYRK